MLDNNKIQYIGKIENSNNVVIINGNLTICLQSYYKKVKCGKI